MIDIANGLRPITYDEAVAMLPALSMLDIYAVGTPRMDSPVGPDTVRVARAQMDREGLLRILRSASALAITSEKSQAAGYGLCALSPNGTTGVWVRTDAVS